MSATLLPFTPPSRRRYEPRILFGAYTPPAGSVVTTTKCGAVIDVEVIEPSGEVAILATCGCADDAAYQARAIAEAYGLEVSP